MTISAMSHERPPTNRQHLNLLKNLRATLERIERLERERDEARLLAEKSAHDGVPVSGPLPWEKDPHT